MPIHRYECAQTLSDKSICPSLLVTSLALSEGESPFPAPRKGAASVPGVSLELLLFPVISPVGVLFNRPLSGAAQT